MGEVHERTSSRDKWFFHYEGNKIGDWKTAWYAALVRAGLRTKDENEKWVNEVRSHDTRRHAATFNSEAGVSRSRSDNQQSLGHVSRKREPRLRSVRRCKADTRKTECPSEAYRGEG